MLSYEVIKSKYGSDTHLGDSWNGKLTGNIACNRSSPEIMETTLQCWH